MGTLCASDYRLPIVLMNFSGPTAIHRSNVEHSDAGRGLCTGRWAVKITLLSDASIRLEAIPGPVSIEAPSPEQNFSPFHMMASALGYCTFSVMHSWAEHAKLDASDLTLDVSWEFSEHPHRVGKYDIRFCWPSLPELRLDAARRVAEKCAVHATLAPPPVITVDHAP